MARFNINFKKPDLTWVGLVLIFAGIILLLIASIVTCISVKKDSEMAGLAATAFFNIMLGMAMVYPDMLEGSSGSTSSMRVSVFMIISVFVVLVVKTGWGEPDLDHFKLDQTWAYVIGVALGAKTIQYFGEKMLPVGSKGNVAGQNTIQNQQPKAVTLTRDIPKEAPAHILTK